MVFGSFVTTWEPSDNARQMMSDLSAAIVRARRQLKAGADALGMSAAMLSRLLNAQHPSLPAKLADHPDIERELIAIRASRLGLRVVDEDLARAIEAGNKQEARIA